MDKIKKLMIESGLSQDAANAICGSLDNHVAARSKKLDEQFKQRLAKAKKICMEEVQDHKRELSRRFQIFIEAKQSSIEENLRKQAIDKETAAAATLEKVSNLIEGLNIDGQPNSELKAQVQQLVKVNKALKEEKTKAVQKANHSIGLAEKVMSKNRDLERSIAESKQRPKGKGRGQSKKQRRIDESRQRGTATTTRRTSRSNQNAVIAEEAQRSAGQQMIGPNDIAESMDVQL